MATSPAVGIFRPEVAVGARVRAGDRVGVVDLLGIPQDVPSPMDGILVEVFPAAGEAVEYGEAIAAVEAEVPQAPVDATDPDAADTSDDGESSEAAGAAAADVAGIAAADGERG
jgi:acetyl/propionyl-CoA carboxylase alpha subunit